MTLREWIGTNFYNDMNSIPIYLFVFGTALLIMGCATFFHELGHLLYFKLNLKKNIKVKFVFNSLWNFYWEAGEEKDYEGMSIKQNHDMLLCGVMMGCIPIVVSMLFWNPFIMLLIPYSSGSWKDIKNMAELKGIITDNDQPDLIKPENEYLR